MRTNLRAVLTLVLGATAQVVRSFAGRGRVRVLQLKLSANQATLTIDKLLVRRKAREPVPALKPSD